MTQENKNQKCHCCLGLGAVVLIAGVIAGVVNGFGLPHGLAVIVGIALIIMGKKGTNVCKCCFGKPAPKKEKGESLTPHV